jgi:flavodoxin
MKFIFRILIAIVIAGCLAPAGLCGAEELSSGKVLILYYSRTGNTKAVCEALQKELGCDIIEINDLKNREGRWGYYTAAFGSIFGTHTGIDPAEFNLTSYETIIVGSPVWAGKPSAAIRTFIGENRFDGKDMVVLYTTNVLLKETSLDRAKKMVVKSGGRVAGCFQIAVTEKIDGKKVELSKKRILEDAAKVFPEIKKILVQ